MSISLGEWETLIVLVPIKKNSFSPVQNMCFNQLVETETTIHAQFQICQI